MLIIRFLLTIQLLFAVGGQTGKGANLISLLEREMALRNWRQTDEVVFSGLLFFGSFLLEEQKK
jgi:hypothetical protein